MIAGIAIFNRLGFHNVCSVQHNHLPRCKLQMNSAGQVEVTAGPVNFRGRFPAQKIMFAAYVAPWFGDKHETRKLHFQMKDVMVLRCLHCDFELRL